MRHGISTNGLIIALVLWGGLMLSLALMAGACVFMMALPTGTTTEPSKAEYEPSNVEITERVYTGRTVPACSYEIAEQWSPEGQDEFFGAHIIVPDDATEGAIEALLYDLQSGKKIANIGVYNSWDAYNDAHGGIKNHDAWKKGFLGLFTKMEGEAGVFEWRASEGKFARLNYTNTLY